MRNHEYEHIATTIVNARQKKNVTQTKLATALGFTSSQYISNIERGTCALAPKHFKRTAKTLGIPAYTLVEASAMDYYLRLRRESGI